MAEQEQQEYAEKGGWMFDSVRSIRAVTNNVFEVNTPDGAIFMKSGKFYRLWRLDYVLIEGNLTNKYLRMKVEQYVKRIEEQAKWIKQQLND